MKTALTQVIENIRQKYEEDLKISKLNLPEPEKEFVNAKIQVWTDCLMLVISHLPVEKEQMNRSYRVAEGDSKFDTKTRFDKGLLFEDYYKETYETK